MTVGLSPYAIFFFLTKNEGKKNRFADGLIKLANRGFGLSTDASLTLKSVKKFLDKKVRTCNSRSRSPPYPSHLLHVFYFTMLCSQIDLYFWNRLPNYLASAREAYKSLACRNSFTITLLLLWATQELCKNIN